jgi:hypothetical protein
MSDYEGNKAVADKLLDLHKGLHVAMDALIKKQDYEKTQLVLHQMDEQFTRLINLVKIVP